MTSEQGTIIKTNGNNAWVRVKRSTMCECCKSRSSCETLGGGGDMEAEALNTAGGKVGDRVLLRISSKSLLKISFIFYMTPVLALIIGAVIGNKIGEKLSLNPDCYMRDFFCIHKNVLQTSPKQPGIHARNYKNPIIGSG